VGVHNKEYSVRGDRLLERDRADTVASALDRTTSAESGDAIDLENGEQCSVCNTMEVHPFYTRCTVLIIFYSCCAA
jgi:hypothetical protein